jgi:DNA end-binding protein Ku
MPSSRAYWKGFLRLSLVAIPVNVYNAIDSTNDISFRQIHRPSGRRVQYSKTVEGIGPVESADIAKGYEVAKDQYVIIEPDELDSIKLESKQTIDLVQFVDVSEIDYRYFERPYFLSPGNKMAGEGYVVIRDALKKMNRIGLGQVTIGGREWLVAVKPLDDGLIMEMLRYAPELKKPAEFFDDVPTEKPQKEMLDLASQLIEQKTRPFAPEAFEDHYQTALRALVEDKVKGRVIVAAPKPSRPGGANVIDLMAALKKSLGQPPGKTPSKAEPKPDKPSKGKGRGKKSA